MTILKTLQCHQTDHIVKHYDVISGTYRYQTVTLINKVREVQSTGRISSFYVGQSAHTHTHCSHQQAADAQLASYLVFLGAKIQ